ncbi:mitochondrial Complex I (CI) NADH:ubiquinone oxidoreductase subunit B13/NUFM/NDUFA5 [Andalucia godoyi]|uniref:Mitochondrial Complex I (CI) NADH:ubiquinone oxidoreductase subunit B13/NUFM/NDUFA5 n=1 Tax=Andalucia godoyi TaxID=505711 RepID=A0A8K0AHR1_ANDGO|nr:mitochondrial Complex I (CI) NADH:ubiquinone oxidoreductase subunit B13/NUFM/NDUFA5 [Andalucia godoyi]|eukprot:ANDGO_06756.mRNA.1 mitochondrial Complex I (CI) NADH:ubiquinone oxidoreductase subunit B13/NUFM/NDUFA5
MFRRFVLSAAPRRLLSTDASSIGTKDPLPVGMKTEPHALIVLENLYRKLVSDVSAFPEAAVYRKNVEAASRAGIEAIRSAREQSKGVEEQAVAAIEAKYNVASIEFLIRSARKEISLAAEMTQWKPWSTQN